MRCPFRRHTFPQLPVFPGYFDGAPREKTIVIHYDSSKALRFLPRRDGEGGHDGNDTWRHDIGFGNVSNACKNKIALLESNGHCKRVYTMPVKLGKLS